MRYLLRPQLGESSLVVVLRAKVAWLLQESDTMLIASAEINILVFGFLLLLLLSPVMTEQFNRRLCLTLLRKLRLQCLRALLGLMMRKCL